MRRDILHLVLRGQGFTLDMKEDFHVIFYSPPFLIEMSPLRPVCDGIRPLVPVVVVIIQYNHHMWELCYTTFVVDPDTRGRGFLGVGDRLGFFVVRLESTP